MPKKPIEGDTVQISNREPTPADTKSQLFFPHVRGLRGTLSKLYTDGTALILVDPDSLPADARKRHDTGTSAMRQKWLDGLSDEARNRLSAAEKKFFLRYSLLVSQEDLLPADASQAAVPPARKSLEDMTADEARHLDEKKQSLS